MICPAILDPFQGTNYRIAACMHQFLLCPIIAKTFGYLFSPASTEKSVEQNSSDVRLIGNDATVDNAVVVSNAKYRVQNDVVNHSIYDGTDSANIHHAKANTKLHNEYGAIISNNTTTTNGKQQQFENGCDIIDNSSNFGDVSTISYPNDSNKKTQ